MIERKLSCPRCNGAGVIKQMLDTERGLLEEPQDSLCYTCWGSGAVDGKISPKIIITSNPIA